MGVTPLPGVRMDSRDASSADPPLRPGTVVDFLGRIDYRNLRMLPNALSILARPSAADWWYNRDLVSRELPQAVRNLLVDPGSMNVFQRHCPVAGYVSTPADGVLAGFTERGRMSTLLCPHTGYTQQLPYYETGGTLLDGARPREGAFFGVEVAPGDAGGDDRSVTEGDRRVDGARVTWLWEGAFDHEMDAGSSTGALSVTYEPRGTAPVRATERAVVPPGSETVVRELTVENVGHRSVSRIVYYMQANANDRQQYLPGITSPNRVVAGDGGVEWHDAESDRRIALSSPDPVAATGAVDGPLDEAFGTAKRAREGRHVGGFLAVDVDLAPGESTTVTVGTGWGGEPAGERGDGPAESLAERRPDGSGAGRIRADGASAGASEPVGAVDATGRPDSAERDEAVASEGTESAGGWGDWLADAPVERVPDRFAEQYERSVEGLLKLCDPASGSISAAPNFQPMYYPSWPRDGAFVAVALAEAGAADPATAYLADFLPRVQGTDGGFEQCYTSDGRRAGIIPRENDQQGIYAHAVRAVHEATGDDAFLAAAWPAVADALEYTVDAVADNGLLLATPDFAEMPTDARQSLWANAFAYRGLLDGAAMAERVADAGGDRVGDAGRAAAERYRRAARHVGDAVERNFFAGRERFATELTVRGAERGENVAYSAAVHPTGWAADYGYVDELLDGFEAVHRDGKRYWLPREFTYAASLYAAGREADGDRVLERLQTERLPGGTLAEEVDGSGDHKFAALGWANAAFVHALHVREGIAADVA